jgi:hypothetical protein
MHKNEAVMKLPDPYKEIVPIERPKPTNWFVYIPWSNRPEENSIAG